MGVPMDHHHHRCHHRLYEPDVSLVSRLPRRASPNACTTRCWDSYHIAPKDDKALQREKKIHIQAEILTGLQFLLEGTSRPVNVAGLHTPETFCVIPVRPFLFSAWNYGDLTEVAIALNNIRYGISHELLRARIRFLQWKSSSRLGDCLPFRLRLA